MKCAESFLKIMFPSVTSGVEFRGPGSTGSRFKLNNSRFLFKFDFHYTDFQMGRFSC